MSCVGNLGIPLERFILGKFLSCIRDVKDPSKVKREGGISLETLQRKWASFRVEERISWIFTSCGRKLRVPLELQQGCLGPLVLPQESPVSMQVARDLSGFLSSRFLSQRPHLELRPGLQGSSPVLTWIFGFLWSFNRGVWPHLVWRHSSPLSSRAVTVVSGFLSSRYRDQCLSLEVPQGCHSCHRVLS